MWLLALFVTVPLIEIALFIQVGGWLSLWPTLAIVVATAILGTWLVRKQGLQVLADVKNALSCGSDPVSPLAHGALIVLAGALLLTPGFLTDAIGFALMIAPFRTELLKWAARRGMQRVFVVGAAGSGHPDAGSQPRDTVIDAEFVDITRDDGPPHGRGPARGAGEGSRWTRH